MKKKYIQYRSGLLIGLLSLNTLSSCVSTRQRLGMNGWGSKDAERGGNGSSSNTRSRWDQAKHYAKEGMGYAAAFGAGVLAKTAHEYARPGGTGSNSTGYNNTGASSNAWGTFDPSRR